MALDLGSGNCSDATSETQRPKLQSVLADMITQLNNQGNLLEQLRGSVEACEGTIEGQAKTLEEIRSEARATATRVSELLDGLSVLSKEVQSLQDRLNQMEDCARRQEAVG